MHGIPCLGKNILSIVHEEAEPDIKYNTPNNVYHVKRRRREEAVAVQLINGERLTIAGVSHLRNFRDTFNAYLSVNHEAALDPLETVNDPVLHDLISNHIQNNLFA